MGMHRIWEGMYNKCEYEAYEGQSIFNLYMRVMDETMIEL